MGLPLLLQSEAWPEVVLFAFGMPRVISSASALDLVHLELALMLHSSTWLGLGTLVLNSFYIGAFLVAQSHVMPGSALFALNFFHLGVLPTIRFSA